MAAALLLVGLLPAGAVSAAPAAPVSTTTYTNPVSKDFADTFADPTIVRGLDGLWYAYGTSDPLREGEKIPHRIPMARSSNLVDWTYVGDAFGAGQLPSYAAPGAALWAPDVRYLDGRWVMYFTVTDTTVSADTFDTAIGAATAPSPTGPWTFAPTWVVAPRPGPGGGVLSSAGSIVHR
jgi:arabinan endo-1,5-alpha-L-arabinosidase